MAHDIVVVDDVPPLLSGPPAPATVVGFPTATWDGDKLTFATIATLAPGASTTLKYTGHGAHPDRRRIVVHQHGHGYLPRA